MVDDPKALAKLVDTLYKTRERRYALQREVSALEEAESAIRAQLIGALPKFGATGIAGKVARAQLEGKRIVRVEDWEKLYAHIVKKKAFDLLQRRVSDAAVKERWEAKLTVPGVVPETVAVVSLSKLK